MRKLSLLVVVLIVDPASSTGRSKYRKLVGQNDAAAVSYVSDVRKKDWKSVRDFETHFGWITPQLFRTSMRGSNSVVTNSLLNEKCEVYQYKNTAFVRLPTVTPEGIVYGNVVPVNPELDLILRQNPASIKAHGVHTVVLPASSETIYFAAKSSPKTASEYLKRLGYPEVPNLFPPNTAWKRLEAFIPFIPHKGVGLATLAFFTTVPDDAFEFSDGTKCTGLELEKNLHNRAAADLQRWSDEMRIGQDSSEYIARGTKMKMSAADLSENAERVELDKLARFVSGGFKKDLLGHLQSKNHMLARRIYDTEEERIRFWTNFERDVNEMGLLATRLGASCGNSALNKLGRVTPHLLSFAKHVSSAHALYQVGSLSSLAGSASIAGALSASLAVVDMFSEHDEAEEGSSGVFEALESIMAQLRDLASVIEEFRYEMRVEFDRLHDRLDQLEHRNFLYFESLSHQLDCVLSQARGMHLVNHESFAALKDQIYQLGQELGFDTAAIATLPLHTLYDRAEDLLHSSHKIAPLSLPDIELAHKEILGPLASWAGTAPHGMFNGLRFQSGTNRIDVDIEVFSRKDSFSVIAYLSHYAADRGFSSEVSQENLGSPHLWLQATRAYMDVRSQVSLPLAGVEPRHFVQMIARGQKLVKVVEEMHRSDPFGKLFKERSDSQAVLVELVSSKRAELQFAFAKEYLLAVSNEHLQRLTDQLEIIRSIKFNLFGDESTRWLWEANFAFSHSGHQTFPIENLDRIHEEMKRQLVGSYQTEVKRIETLQGMLSAEKCPNEAIQLGAKLIRDSRIAELNIHETLKIVIPLSWIQRIEGPLELPPEGFASEEYKKILSLPELFGLGHFKVFFDLDISPSKLGVQSNFQSDSGSTDFESNGYVYTITKKIEFFANPIISGMKSSSRLLLSESNTHTLAPGQADSRLAVLGQAMRAEFWRLSASAFGNIPDIQHLFIPSTQAGSLADSIFAFQFPIKLLRLHHIDHDLPLINSASTIEEKSFALNLYKDWLHAVMNPYANQQVPIDGLGIEIQLAKQVYIRNVKAIEAFAELFGYCRDWSPLYHIAHDQFISDPWLNELYMAEDVLAGAALGTVIQNPIFVELQLRVKQLSRLALQLYSDNAALNSGIENILGELEYNAVKTGVVPVREELRQEVAPLLAIDERLASLETDVKSLRLGQTELRDSLLEMKDFFIQALQNILDIVSRK